MTLTITINHGLKLLTPRNFGVIPKHVNHLRDVVRYLRGLADELKSKN